MVQRMQDTALDNCFEVMEGVRVEEYHKIFHYPKYEREVCPVTDCMLEIMWAGGVSKMEENWEGVLKELGGNWI